MSRLCLGGTHLAGAHAAAGVYAGHGPLHHAGVRGGESAESWFMLGRWGRFGTLRRLHRVRIHDLKFLRVPLKFNKQSVFAFVIRERSLGRNVFNLNRKDR